MQFQLPKEIKIGNRTVPVSVEKIDQNLMGFYDQINPRIVLADNLSPVQMVETFWHELMHAVMDFNRFAVEVMTEMENSDTPQEVAFNVEERTAESFAKTFLQVIQDNNLTEITTVKAEAMVTMS